MLGRSSAPAALNFEFPERASRAKGGPCLAFRVSQPSTKTTQATLVGLVPDGAAGADQVPFLRALLGLPAFAVSAAAAALPRAELDLFCPRPMLRANSDRRAE